MQKSSCHKDIQLYSCLSSKAGKKLLVILADQNVLKFLAIFGAVGLKL